MIGIESFQYLQTSEGLSQISWRGGYDAVDRYEQTINRVRKQHLDLRKSRVRAGAGKASHCDRAAFFVDLRQCCGIVHRFSSAGREPAAIRRCSMRLAAGER
jgi:hypothetical protein